MKLFTNSDSCFALRRRARKRGELTGSYCDFDYQSKVSYQRCSIGLTQFRLLQSVPGTSARHISCIARESQAMGRRQSMGSPSGRGAHQSHRSRKIQTILYRNIGNRHGPALTAITFVLQTSEQFEKKNKKKTDKIGPKRPISATESYIICKFRPVI